MGLKGKKKNKQAFASSVFLLIILLLLHPTYSESEKAKNPGGLSTANEGDDDDGVIKKLRIGVPMKKGFNEFVNVVYDPHSNATIFSGFCIDVFLAAIDSLTYPVAYEFIPIAISGQQVTRSYNDLIYQVYLQKFDAVVGDTTITANRSLYVDFTLPYTEMGMGMIVPMHENDSKWIFLKPLKAELWLTSALFFVLTGFVIWIIERPINDEFQGSRAQQIGMIFWYSFSTLVFAHREKLVSNLSKLVVIVWVFVVLILSSSYTATLTSMLTIQQIKLEYSTLNSVGYQLGTTFAKHLTTNMGFAESMLKPYRSAEEYAIALSKGTKHGGVAVIVDEMPYIRAFLAKYSANHTMIPSPFLMTSNGFGFVFQKGSPLVHDISRAIAMMREEGKLTIFEYKWLHHNLDQLSSTNQYSASNPVSLGLNKFGGLFLITGISSSLALVIFLILSIYKTGKNVLQEWSLCRSLCRIALLKF